jgi:hypothetical protein
MVKYGADEGSEYVGISRYVAEMAEDAPSIVEGVWTNEPGEMRQSNTTDREQQQGEMEVWLYQILDTLSLLDYASSRRRGCQSAFPRYTWKLAATCSR